MLPFYFFLTLLGLAFGSFLGMLTHRLPRSIPLSGRSFCDSCKENIHWYGNIPVFSFLWMWGECGKCGKNISWRYPLIETITAGLFVLTGIFWQNLAPVNGIAFQFRELLGLQSLFLYLFLISIFIALFIIDLEFQILPDSVLTLLLLVTCYLLLFLPSPLLFHHLLTGAISSFFFLLLYLVTRGRGMGFGDVKLSFLIGSLLGYPASLVWLFLAFLTGGFLGAILILAKKARFGQHIPFGPFLIFGAIIAFGFGEVLFKWYLSLL